MKAVLYFIDLRSPVLTVCLEDTELLVMFLGGIRFGKSPKYLVKATRKNPGGRSDNSQVFGSSGSFKKRIQGSKITAEGEKRRGGEGRERTENKRNPGITECNFSFVHLS